MATKKYQEVQEINDSDLKETLAETETAYQKLTFDHAIRGLDNPLELRDLRRDVARLKTEIRRREVAAMTPEQLAKRSKIRARRKNK
ncbi:MAG: 50S ribosomal protein L29 [Saprospiraceae bacterium]|nr:50S ribosomal protein L29 [Saprospiraceae bacterium]MDG1432815.1 50S ribosomal protein L29 [Saprospiraceae bacterium]MDG2418009.1 50S ribosomal protein L29 [Saprospiraceae bacterium]